MRYSTICLCVVTVFAITFGMGYPMLPTLHAASTDCTARGPGVDLSWCNLSGMDLSGEVLNGADLRHANLSATNFDRAFWPMRY
jgi:hypothetical protein